MMNDWKEQLNSTKQSYSLFRKANPVFNSAFMALRDAGHAENALDEKTRELIAIAVAVTTHCDTCIASHVQAAKKAGATNQEIGDALAVAVTLNAGAAFVYSLRTLEAVEQFSAS